MAAAEIGALSARLPLHPHPAAVDAALDLQEALAAAEARAGRSRLSALRDADAALGRLRIFLRLAHRWRWLSDGQYAHAGGMVGEIGRLLGGWLKSEKAQRRSTTP